MYSTRQVSIAQKHSKQYTPEQDRDREGRDNGNIKRGLVLEKRVGLVFSRGTRRILLDLTIDLLSSGLDSRAVHGDVGLLSFGAFGLCDELFGFESSDTAGAWEKLVLKPGAKNFDSTYQR